MTPVRRTEIDPYLCDREENEPRPQYVILLDFRTYLAKGVTSRKPSRKLGDFTLS